MGFFSKFSLSVSYCYCIETTDFCILILYSSNLLYSFINSNSFLVTSFRFSTYNIMSSAKSDNFTSSFPIWVPFFFFLIHLLWLGLPHTMLHRSSESRHPCLAPDHRGSAFSFLPLSVMLGVGLLYMDFIMLRYIPFIPTSLSFYHGYWIPLYQLLLIPYSVFFISVIALLSFAFLCIF